MSLRKEISYLFDFKLKMKMLGMIVIILLGSIVELLGVAIILPIIELVASPDSMEKSKYCQLVSRVTGVTDAKNVLLILIFSTIGLYILKNIYLAWMTFMMNRFSKNIKMIFSARLMECYMKQPYSYFLRKNTAEILRSVINDTVGMYTAITNGLQFVSQGATTLFIIVYLAWTNFVMTIAIAAMLGGAALIIVLGVQRKTRRLGQKFQSTAAGIMQTVKQSFEGIKEIKIANKEERFIRDFKHVFDKSTQIELHYNLLSGIPKYMIETICVGGIMGYMAIAIISGGDMSTMLPQLSVFAMGAFKMLPSMNNLYASFSNILYNKVSIDLVYQNIKETENISNHELESDNVVTLSYEKEIALEAVSFAYDGADKDVFSEVSIQIPRGKSVAFVGESGSGKTTLVDVILGILKPHSGSVLVDGVNIEENVRGWHRNIGYIPQMIYLLDDSIRKNIAFGIPDEEINDERVWEVLRSARLYDFVKGLKDGLDTEVGEAGTRLSGGQRQRIGIARALYHNPEVLVFDEATSALDSETEKEVMEAIDGLHGMKTMLMIAHRLTTIENCDYVYRVEKQRVIRER